MNTRPVTRTTGRRDTTASPCEESLGQDGHLTVDAHSLRSPLDLSSLMRIIRTPHPFPLQGRPRGVRGDLSDGILALLTSSAYRKGSLVNLQVASVYNNMLATVRRCVGSGTPIQLTLMAFPFKVPNPAKVGSRTLPDLAELVAIKRFVSLRAAVTRLYEPGLNLHIIHDGVLLSDVFGVEREEIRAYEDYFRMLVRTSLAADFIRCHDFGVMQLVAGMRPASRLGKLRREAELWWKTTRGTPEWRTCFRRSLGMLNLRHLSMDVVECLLREATKGCLPSTYRDVELRAYEAMIEYRVRDAVIHQFDPRPSCFPDAIHTTTHDRPGRLSLWLVQRGRGLLPWHGVGMVDARGRGRVALAVDVLRRPNVRPLLLAEEDTPFLYWESDQR